MSCSGCRFCKVAETGKKTWKCKLDSRKRFDIIALHGWICRWRREEHDN